MGRGSGGGSRLRGACAVGGESGICHVGVGGVGVDWSVAANISLCRMQHYWRWHLLTAGQLASVISLLLGAA